MSARITPTGKRIFSVMWCARDGTPLASMPGMDTYSTQLLAAERQILSSALTECAGCVQRAARALGVSRRTLYNRLALCGLQAHEYRAAAPGAKPASH